jgi:hypothetical protein
VQPTLHDQNILTRIAKRQPAPIRLVTFRVPWYFASSRADKSIPSNFLNPKCSSAETPEQEIQQFIKRLRKLGAGEWPRSSEIVELFCGRDNGLNGFWHRATGTYLRLGVSFCLFRRHHLQAARRTRL